MSELPRLPQNISPNGQELWDWASRVGHALHERDRIAEFRRDLARIGRVCGDCDKWMKSRECPQERPVNGRSRGPSMSQPRCSQFVESWSATARRSELVAALQEPRS